jgi:hypothetical protein
MLKIIGLILIAFQTLPAWTKEPAKLDTKLEPLVYQEDVSSIFEDVVAVQRKAKKKSQSILFWPYLSFDFSDSPYTMYGLNTNVGIALGESLEIYANFTPHFLTQDKAIVHEINQLQTVNGRHVVLDTGKAQHQLGGEFIWSPIYGKESWGPYGIVRSETFLDIAFGQVTYDNGVGLRSKLGIGKTYFFSHVWNVRLLAGSSFVQRITNGQKQTSTVGLLEAGMVYYF